MHEPFRDAVGLAECVHRAEISAREAVEAAIARIEAANPTVNAVVHERFEAALVEAANGVPNGPLRGVPLLVKDLGVEVAGLPATAGSRLFAEYRSRQDSEIVARYRRAGLVVLGTTNTPEFGKNASTEPVLFGSARNPWRDTRSCGGSSGGSAAAVAAGMVPVAHGSDGAGSIRIPAAMCGLFGLKPSRGRVPSAPSATNLCEPLAVHHALTATVRDSAAMLDAVVGPVPGSPDLLPPGSGPFSREPERSPGRLRIAVTTTVGGGGPVDPQCAAAVDRMAATCVDLGHDVVEAAPSYDAHAATLASSTIMVANLVARVDARLAELGRGLRDDDVEPFTRVMVERGRTVTAADLATAMHDAARIGRCVEGFFDDHDLLLTPTVAAPVPELGILDTLDPEVMYRRAGSFAAFTGVFNLTGHPAVSVPSGHDGDGLPLGAQFVAPFGAEATLLRMAGQLERSSPWPLPH